MQPKFDRLTDSQWEFMKQFLDWQRKRKIDLRDVLDAIFYITRTGIQWRNLPSSEYPHWKAVYYYFDKWKNDGTFQAINLELNDTERAQKGRLEGPTLLLVDSQSVKLAPMIKEERGIDGNKKVNGRKRHILVDVKGRIYQVHVHAANRHDSPEGVNLLQLKAYNYERLKKIMADKSYRGTFAEAVENLGFEFEVPERPKDTKGFVVEAKRWVVERTFAWLKFFRRVVMDYERTPESAGLFLIIANISMCLWRIHF